MVDRSKSFVKLNDCYTFILIARMEEAPLIESENKLSNFEHDCWNIRQSLLNRLQHVRRNSVHELSGRDERADLRNEEKCIIPSFKKDTFLVHGLSL